MKGFYLFKVWAYNHLQFIFKALKTYTYCDGVMNLTDCCGMRQVTLSKLVSSCDSCYSKKPSLRQSDRRSQREWPLSVWEYLRAELNFIITFIYLPK